LIYEDIEKYLKEKDETKRKEISIQIYVNYLDGRSSPLEVNVNFKTRLIIKGFIHDNVFHDDLFDLCQKTIRANLSDTFSRFQNTPSYLQYLSKQRLKKDLGVE
jgi:hypothetical protein